MRVGLDLQATVGTPTGIGEYAQTLAAALAASGRVDVVPLLDARYDLWRFDRRVWWDQVGLPRAIARGGVDLVHCTSGTMPLASSRPVVLSIHDLAWHRVQSHAPPYARAYFGSIALALARRARRIVAISEFSRAEFLAHSRRDPGDVDVVYPVLSEDFARVARRPDAEPFALAVGTVERRKNLAVVIRALVELPGMRLVSVGPPTPYRDECVALARSLGVGDRVEFRGFVARAALLDLYARATAAVVPSTYEGFGYGVAQAIAAGVPLVVANASSLPEVASGSGALADPHDPSQWHAALAAVLGSRESAEAAANAVRTTAARFSPATAAVATVAAYERALAARPGSP